jgi:hypothetical protein
MEGMNMRNVSLTEKTFMFVALASLSLSFIVGSPVKAASSDAGAETYTWSAELVALDEANHMLTAKTYVVADQPKAEFKAFKAGDRVLLGLSGFDKFASGINRARRYTAGTAITEKFSFPVEFVSFDAQTNYVTFKTTVPADGMAKIRTLKPGEWITATSPQTRPEAQPIVSIRPYVILPNEHSN